MTDFENRARSAGAALRGWAPDGSAPTPDTAVRRAVHRTRAHRATAGGLLVVALGGVGLLWGPSRGDDVETSPVGSLDDVTTTTEAPEPTTSTTSTTADPDPGAGPTPSVETTTPTTAPPTTTVPPEEPVATSCTGQITGTGITFTATVPAGWSTNETAMGEPGCYHFGPEPIELRPDETVQDVGVASNAVVRLYVSEGPGGVPIPFEHSVVVEVESRNVNDLRRTTVDGHPAARIEHAIDPGDDVPEFGERYIHWTIDLGDLWFDAVTMSEPGVSYEESVAAIDQIVASLDFTA